MRGSGFNVGRIFGITIRVDWSWLLIFFLITWNLATAFGQFRPGWSAPMQWGLAVLAALLFFASVLAHELAHSLTARARGVPVRSITLFLFGGVSNIEREPPSPVSEFLITVVGPATSFILGIVLLWLGGSNIGSLNANLTDPASLMQQMAPLNLLLLWLGSINLILAIFNLVPGFPLDGGRILRSILWALTSNLRRATRWSSWVGQGIAWLMIIGGIAMVFGASFPILGSGLVNGLWLAFIGWFLNSASRQSYHQVVIRDILEDVPVERLMRRDPPSVHPDQTIGRLVHDTIMNTDDHAFPVIENGQFLGLVTLEDVRSVPEHDWEQTTVRQTMTNNAELVTVNTGDDAADALEKLMRRDVRQLPVMSGPQLAGLLRRRDIVKWLQLHADSLSV